nr:xaa-Pro dipeptidase-like [Nerophis lumbriciformis]
MASDNLAFIGHEAKAAEDFGAKVFNPEGLIERLHDRRTLKTPYEITCMAAASELAVKGHLASRDAFYAGETSELAIHLAYLSATELDDPQTPYKNIVALNDAAAILHHIHYRKVDSCRSLLIDAGGAHRGYCSDITRTYAAKSEPAFGALVERMDVLQQKLLERIEVGMPYEALHDASHEMMGALVVEAGLFNGSAEAAVSTGVTRKLFPHGLGHSLGVQVHDVGMKKTAPREDNPYLRNTSTITAGQVFTVEPGLYFIDSFLADLKAMDAPMNWDTIEALKPCGGIRIEDNILVLDNGIRNLTREQRWS